eukprot:790173-Pelagomonas_calceolata.AAC.2
MAQGHKSRLLIATALEAAFGSLAAGLLKSFVIPIAHLVAVLEGLLSAFQRLHISSPGVACDAVPGQGLRQV